MSVHLQKESHKNLPCSPVNTFVIPKDALIPGARVLNLVLSRCFHNASTCIILTLSRLNSAHHGAQSPLHKKNYLSHGRNTLQSVDATHPHTTSKSPRGENCIDRTTGGKMFALTSHTRNCSTVCKCLCMSSSSDTKLSSPLFGESA